MNERINMKAGHRRIIAAGGLMLILAGAISAPADTVVQQKTLDTFEGTVASLNARDKTITIDALLISKTFNIPGSCTFTMEGKSAPITDLRPGQEVKVSYEKRDGVLVSLRIDQHDVTFEGRISNIDLEKRRMEVSESWKSREFALPDDCLVVLHENRSGTLQDLHTGQRVTVVYESPPDKPYQARKIEESYETFSTTIHGFDRDSRGIKANTLLSEEKFNLADNGKVVLTDTSKSDLRNFEPSGHVEFSYDNENGVPAADCVTQKQDIQQDAGTVQESARNGVSR